MKPYRLSDDMLWKPDSEVDALSKLPFWVEFHQSAGKRGLAFDRPVKSGRTYTCVAFTPKKNDQGGWVTFHLADGTGKTPLDAIEDAYRKSGRTDSVLDDLWGKVRGVTAAEVAEVADVEDFESMFD